MRKIKNGLETLIQDKDLLVERYRSQPNKDVIFVGSTLVAGSFLNIVLAASESGTDANIALIPALAVSGLALISRGINNSNTEHLTNNEEGQ